MENISDSYQKKIQAMKNKYLPDMKYNKTYLNSNYKKMIGTLTEKYPNVATLSSYLVPLAVLSKELGADKAYKAFIDLGASKMREYQDVKKKGDLSANEIKHIHTFINYSIHREICYNDWASDIKHEKKMYRSLIMALITMYPPLRASDYIDLKIVKNTPRDKNNNYLLIKDGLCSIILNVPAKTKDEDLEFKAGTYRLNDLLSARIIESLQHFPRKELIELDLPKVYQILNTIYPGKQVVRLSYMRTSYETFIRTQKFSYKFRELVSNRMLHDVTTADKIYDRVTIPEEAENKDYNWTIAFVDKNHSVVVKDETPDWEYLYPIVIIEDEDDPEPEMNVPIPEPMPVYPRMHTSSGVDVVLDDDGSYADRHKQALAKYIAKPENRKKHKATDYLGKLTKGIIKKPSDAKMAEHGIIKVNNSYAFK